MPGDIRKLAHRQRVAKEFCNQALPIGNRVPGLPMPEKGGGVFITKFYAPVNQSYDQGFLQSRYLAMTPAICEARLRPLPYPSSSMRAESASDHKNLRLGLLVRIAPNAFCTFGLGGSQTEAKTCFPAQPRKK